MTTPKLVKHANGVHYIHWTAGRRSKRLTTHQRDATAASTYFGQWLLNEHRAPADGACVFLVKDLWQAYCEGHEVASPRSREASWKNLSVHFGEMTVAEVTYEAVEEYELLRVEGGIGRPSVQATVRRELIGLRACFNWCAKPKRKLLKPAEMPQFDLPPEGEPRDRWLRMDAIQKLLKSAATLRHKDKLSRGERFLWLALETAARKGAILDLTWDRVDFEAGVVHYNVPGRKKTKKRRTSVPISKALRPVLERAFTERTNQDRTDGLVLENKSDVWPIIQRIAEHAGVVDVSPHVLRHSSATHMARKGVPLWKIAGVLGNSIQMVEKVYAKHCPEGLADAVEMISNGVLEAAE